MAKASPTASEDAAAAAAAILPLIRRVSPGAMEKMELVEASGMETDELREGLDCLLAEGKIEETDDGYKLAGREAETAAAASKTPPPPAEEDEGDGAGPHPAVPVSVVGGNDSRAIMEVIVTYAGGDRDEETAAKAAAMEEEIADLIHQRYPDSVTSVEVKRVEGYTPRLIFDREAMQQD